MIGIQLKGRLGNQMFQYATARTLADRLNCALVTAAHTVGRRFGLVGHLLGLDERGANAGMRQNGILHAAFGCGPSFLAGRAVELALPALRQSLWARTFAPRRRAIAGGRSYEDFDADLLTQQPGTWLDGWFQSERYFAANAGRVRQWFSPRARDRDRIERLAAAWPAAPDTMVAMHIRRGDYANIRDGLGDGEQGWLLPMDYYRRALAGVPREARLALFSDDPDWAAAQFADWRPWVARGNAAGVDMLLMGRCRWNIIANSSFSWWAAWLNARADRIVIAPRYHLGWRLQRWVPGGIEVAGWNYLDV